MKIGTPINQLATRILTEAKSKKDFIADTRKLRMSDEGLIQLDGLGDRAFKPTRLCMDQIANRVGIPSKYAERMVQEAPALLASNVNHWFAAKAEKRMVRTLDNGTQVARAFLSDRYRALDNYDLAQQILPKLVDAGCEIKSCELTERRLYIQAVTARLEAEVKKGDAVQAGICISNSEVGCGSIKIEPLVFRLVCLNGLILPTSLRKHHVGRAGDGGSEGDDSYEVFSDATRKLSDKAFWAQVRDVVDSSMNEIKFRNTVKELGEKASGTLGDPQAIVEVVSNRLDLNEAESSSVLRHLTLGGDLSLWGLCNAVTRTAEDAADYDRAIDLERAGAVVLEMKPTDFSSN